MGSPLRSRRQCGLLPVRLANAYDQLRSAANRTHSPHPSKALLLDRGRAGGRSCERQSSLQDDGLEVEETGARWAMMLNSAQGNAVTMLASPSVDGPD